MTLPFREEDKDEFLNGEEKWSSRIGYGWHGTKLLGQGGNGVVGLWEWSGPDTLQPTVDKVVVKMSENGKDLFPMKEAFARSKIDEGIILSKLARLKSRHIIRQFGGNRLGDHFGEMGSVVRIFLEYCPGGNCDQFLARFGQPPADPLPEMDLWALFHCMALGIMVMARGTEDPNAPAWAGVQKDTELVHFDIKTDNILLGYKDEDHTRVPVAKIADFGEAYEVKAVNLQDDAYGSQNSWRGMEYYHPPEETVRRKPGPLNDIDNSIPLNSPRKGTCSNIWQVGAVMNQLLIRVQRQFDNGAASRQCRTTNFDPNNGKLTKYPNHTLDLETDEIKSLYSKELISLVMECMIRPPLERPGPVELANRTEAGLKISTEAAKDKNGVFPPLPPGISNVPYKKYIWEEPPTLWEVSDTKYEDTPPPPPVTPSRSSRWWQPTTPVKKLQGTPSPKVLTPNRLFSPRATLSSATTSIATGLSIASRVATEAAKLTGNSIQGLVETVVGVDTDMTHGGEGIVDDWLMIDELPVMEHRPAPAPELSLRRGSRKGMSRLGSADRRQGAGSGRGPGSSPREPATPTRTSSRRVTKRKSPKKSGLNRSPGLGGGI